MKNKSLKRLVMASLFAALACVATLFIQVPVPATGGYLNLGDGIVLLSGWLLGPVYGTIAAGIGSALADAVTGYYQYVPATFVIKALMALIAALTGKKLLSRSLGAVAAELWMAFGYFVYEATILSYGFGAIAAVPMNLLQGLFGILVSMVLYFALQKVTRGKDII